MAAWNVARGLSDTDRHAQVEAGIESLDADVVILSESLDDSGKPVNQRFAAQLGYESLTVPYNDTEPHPSREQHITLLSRISIDASEVRLDTRNAIKATVPFASRPGSFDLFGAHFDDRDENTRLRMTAAFLEQANEGVPTVLAGDLNSMYAEDRVATILRSGIVRGLAHNAPHPRIRSLGTRLTEMASGGAMNALVSAGFQDADTAHQPTMTKAGLKVALDHIVIRSGAGARDFQNHRLTGSDHRAISASIS